MLNYVLTILAVVNTVLADREATAALTCCDLLFYRLGSIVFRRSSQSYADSLNSYFSDLETEVKPKCVIGVKSTKDVSEVVHILADQNTQRTPPSDCHFAIRGGGIAPWAGAANAQGGVTIDLSAIKHVSVSADSKITVVGGGAKWKDIYVYLDPRDLAVVGGRVSEVGVGGE